MNGRLETQIKTDECIKKYLMGMPEYVNDYYYSIASSKESKSCRQYLTQINKFLKYLNYPEITEIKYNEIAKYMKSIEYIEKNGEIISTSFSYRKNVHTILNSFFNYFYKLGIISNNPIGLIDRPKATDDVTHELLTKEDLNNIIKTVDTLNINHHNEFQTERDKTIMMLFITTGMRKTALSEINLNDIDFKDNSLKIIDKRHKTHNYYLPTIMINQFNRYIKQRDKLLINNNAESDAMFISRNCTRIGITTIDQMVQKYTRAAIGRELSPHKLRSAFCTALYEETHDIEFVRDAVGHASTETTQRYIVKKDNVKIKSANIMSGIIS